MFPYQPQGKRKLGLTVGFFPNSIKTPIQVRECQAEAVSYVVSRYLGIENPFARDYLLSYGNTAEELADNLDQVQQAGHFMIGKITDTNRDTIGG